jgi:hypothetical protein
MEMSGQLHTATALTPWERDHCYSLCRKLVDPRGYEFIGEKKYVALALN